MGQMSNEELVKKAAIVADDLSTSGKLNNAQSDRFIDFVIDETVLKDNARVVRFRNESLEIDKIGVGKRVTVPKSEAVDPGVRRGISTSKITLTPKELMTPFEIGDNFRELNIEGDNVEETVIRMMSTQTANDIEDGYINGNALGPAVLESDYLDGGSTTQYVEDLYLKLYDGWSQLAEGANIVDAEGGNIGLSIFGKAIRALPTKFRRNKNALRWFISPDLWQLYQEKLSTRGTPLGDSAAGGGQEGHGPFGIKAVPVPLWDFEPLIVEHFTLAASGTVTLAHTNVTNVVVVDQGIGKTPSDPYILDTDYSLDAAAGTITNLDAGIAADAPIKVTYQSPPSILLTHMNNMVVGIGRDVRIEKDRDIYKGVNQYAITTKVAVTYEELTAIVKVKNVGKGV